MEYTKNQRFPAILPDALGGPPGGTWSGPARKGMLAGINHLPTATLPAGLYIVHVLQDGVIVDRQPLQVQR